MNSGKIFCLCLYRKEICWQPKPAGSRLCRYSDSAKEIYPVNIKGEKKTCVKNVIKENISYMYEEEFEKDTSEYPYQVIKDKESIEKILKLYIEKYYDENDDKQTWFDKIKELAGDMGYAKEVKEFKANPGMYKAHVGDVSTVLRVALTKRTNTPDMYEIMQVLGKEKIAKRFETAIKCLK